MLVMLVLVLVLVLVWVRVRVRVLVVLVLELLGLVHLLLLELMLLLNLLRMLALAAVCLPWRHPVGRPRDIPYLSDQPAGQRREERHGDGSEGEDFRRDHQKYYRHSSLARAVAAQSAACMQRSRGRRHAARAINGLVRAPRNRWGLPSTELPVGPGCGRS
jgi:hypothetical protein